MHPVLVALISLFALATMARADAERQEPPTYPFRVERSAEAGQQIAGATGAVIYREKSLGRPAAFLAAPMPAGKWPIDLGPDEPLFPIVFTEKGAASVFYCPDRFKLARRGPRETVCFRDRGSDGRFDEATIGERDQGFLFEITGRWLESTGEDVTGSRVTYIRPPRAIAPTRYAILQVRPNPGDEGMIEVRYAGLRDGKPAFDVSFRAATSKKALYATRVTAVKRRGTTLRATLPHPLIAYRTDLESTPFPAPIPVHARALEVTSMIIDVTKADATRVSATIGRSYAAWSWYRQNCEDDAPELVHVEGGRLPALIRRGEVGLCEKTTWVQNGQWLIAGPENTNSGPLRK